MSSFSTVPSAIEEVVHRFLANVDVWQTIFELLSVKDRIRVEITSKRLHILMLEYWKRVTSFDTECLAEMCDNRSIYKNRLAVFASICVNRIGDGLRSLTIRREFIPIDCWTDHLPSIGEGCPNVETITFFFAGQWLLSKWTLDSHLDSFSRLKTLTATSPFAFTAFASPSFFLSIPVSIEVIRGLGPKLEERFENAAQIEGFFADRPFLREVWLYYLRTRDKSKADMFRVIAERCPHLKSIELAYSDICIDFRGVVALESMKKLRLPHVDLDEMQIVTICERSPHVESLMFYSSNLHLKSAALSAVGSLTKLHDLSLFDYNEGNVSAPSLVIEFVRELARNSGASLRRLHLGMPLPTAASEALANGCPKLRHVEFKVCVGGGEPASIRFLIDSIVAHPSWIHETGEGTLVIKIWIIDNGVADDEAVGGRHAFESLAASAANLPSGVELIIY